METPTIDTTATEDIAASVIAYDVAIIAILHTISREHPATAQVIAKAMEGMLQQFPETQLPKARAKVEKYISGIQKLTAQSPH